jgi:opacity protein-like surface antigen
MSISVKMIALVGSLLAVAAGAATEQSAIWPTFEAESFYDSYIRGRLHVGVSMTSSSAKTTTAPADTFFLGNLNHMKPEERNEKGLNLQYDINDYIALSFANDTHLGVSLWNHYDESTDGSIEIDGMLFQVLLQYPFRFSDNARALTPYVGCGLMKLSTKWTDASWWHYGWSSPSDYKRYGDGSEDPHDGYSRWMILEEPSWAYAFSIGLSFQVLAHLDLDFFYRRVAVDDIDATFHIRHPTGIILREGSFPVDFSTLGFALRFVF